MHEASEGPLARALNSLLLVIINRHRLEPISRSKLMSYLSHLSPTVRNRFSKLLIALILKQKLLEQKQQRSGRGGSRSHHHHHHPYARPVPCSKQYSQVMMPGLATSAAGSCGMRELAAAMPCVGATAGPKREPRAQTRRAMRTQGHSAAPNDVSTCPTATYLSCAGFDFSPAPWNESPSASTSVHDFNDSANTNLLETNFRASPGLVDCCTSPLPLPNETTDVRLRSSATPPTSPLSAPEVNFRIRLPKLDSSCSLSSAASNSSSSMTPVHASTTSCTSTPSGRVTCATNLHHRSSCVSPPTDAAARDLILPTSFLRTPCAVASGSPPTIPPSSLSSPTAVSGEVRHRRRVPRSVGPLRHQHRHRTAPRHSWVNPLPRIFVQAADTNVAESAAAAAASSSSTPSSTPTQSAAAAAAVGTAASAENNGISSSSSASSVGGAPSSNGTKSKSFSSNGGADSSSSSGGGVSSSTSVTASNNPFARSAAPQAQLWNSSSSSSSSSSSLSSSENREQHQHHDRPVLAPSKLGGFGCSSSSSSVLAQPKLPSPAGWYSNMFGGSSSGSLSKNMQSSASAPEVKFKLKPSILGSAVAPNPFSRAPVGDFDLDSKDNEAKSKSTKDSVVVAGASVSTASSTTGKSSLAGLSKESDSSVDSSSEAKSSSAAAVGGSEAGRGTGASSLDTSSLTATPPPSPPHSSCTAAATTTTTSSSSSSSSNEGTAASVAITSSTAAAAGGAEPSSSTSSSVFGVFSEAAAAVAAAAKDKRPAAASSPKPATLSTNGVKSPLPSAGSSSAASSFIFGQNLRTRVTGAGDATASNGSGEAAVAASSAAEQQQEAGGAPVPAISDNFFTAAAVSSVTANSSTGGAHAQNGGGPPVKNLEESSRELAEKESREKRKFDEVAVVTGEETESNVLQMNCKVYSWVRGGWQERGRGILRLNDWGSGGVELHSRLVVRTQGTLTIMLNTNIWGEMSVERAGNKSVRFTASDPDGQPKIYLVMGLPKDIELLYTSLEYRVKNSKNKQRESKRPRAEDQPSSSTSAF